MDRYNHTLFVTHAATDDDTQLLEEAQLLISSDSTQHVSLLHIVPIIPAIYKQLPSLEAYEEKHVAKNRKRMAHIGDFLDIPESQRFLRDGSVRAETRLLITELKIDHVICDKQCRYQLDDVEDLIKRHKEWHFPFHCHFSLQDLTSKRHKH